MGAVKFIGKILIKVFFVGLLFLKPLIAMEKYSGVLVFFPWNDSWNDYMYKDKSKVKKEIQALKALRIKMVRMDFLWDKIEPSKGEWNFKQIDELVAMLLKEDIQILGILGYSATWANKESKWNKAPDQAEDFGNYVYQVVKRYKGKIKYWELWNEPNIPIYFETSHWVDEYILLLKVGYNMAKKANPKAFVLHGGLGQGVVESLDALYRGGGKDYFDGVNIHPFINPIDLTKRPLTRATEFEVKQVLEVMNQWGDNKKNIWITEFGIPGKRDSNGEKGWFLGETTNPEKQAEFAYDSYAHLLNIERVQALFWAFWRDTKHFNNDVDYFGLIDWQGQTKPAYHSISKALKGNQKK